MWRPLMAVTPLAAIVDNLDILHGHPHDKRQRATAQKQPNVLHVDELFFKFPALSIAIKPRKSLAPLCWLQLVRLTVEALRLCEIAVGRRVQHVSADVGVHFDPECVVNWRVFVVNFHDQLDAVVVVGGAWMNVQNPLGFGAIDGDSLGWDFVNSTLAVVWNEIKWRENCSFARPNAFEFFLLIELT
jgi:hypothetical protein